MTRQSPTRRILALAAVLTLTAQAGAQEHSADYLEGYQDGQLAGACAMFDEFAPMLALGAATRPDIAENMAEVEAACGAQRPQTLSRPAPPEEQDRATLARPPAAASEWTGDDAQCEELLSRAEDALGLIDEKPDDLARDYAAAVVQRYALECEPPTGGREIR